MLDIGSGPGLPAHALAPDAGATGSVDGVDPSESTLAPLAAVFGPGVTTAELRSWLAEARHD